MVQEIESKAPVLAAHKRDYHRALVSHEQVGRSREGRQQRAEGGRGVGAWRAEGVGGG